MISREEKLERRFGVSINAKSTVTGIADTFSGGKFSATKGAKRARGANIRATQAATGAFSKFFPQAERAIRTGTTGAIEALAPGAAEQQLAALSGASGADAQAAAFQQFQDSPGQAFLQEQAERGLLRNQAAIGGLGGGNVRRELNRQAIGLAQQDFQNQFNRLQGVADLQGQRGVNTSNLLSGEGTNIANLLQSRATGLANIQTGQGAQLAQLEQNLGTLRGERNLNIGKSLGSMFGGGGAPV